jgi:phosphoribosylanthranilate isomerase
MQPQHALVAAENGADMLGMVFAPSRRRISIDTARGIVAALYGQPNISIMQAMSELDPYVRLDRGNRVRLLLDTYRPGDYGGTGETADWSLAAGIAERLPLILAGGLNPGNVGAAIEQVSPWAVDVSSGVERDGVKDNVLIREFISAARHSSLALKGSPYGQLKR